MLDHAVHRRLPTRRVSRVQPPPRRPFEQVGSL